jgi:hypothetical protein
MIMDYIPKHFESFELVPRETYDLFAKLGKLDQLWWLFDPRILLVGDRLRKRYGPLTCNDWRWGGGNHYRGWRPPGCRVGTMYSQHRFGRALDLIPGEVTVNEIRDEIVHKGNDFGHITCVEMESVHLHVDCRNYKGLLLVYPK